MTLDYDGPVGEHPFLNALAKVDALAATAQKLIDDLTAQRDSARAQLDNLYPALVAAHDANVVMARELKAHRDELNEAEREIDRLSETACRVSELEDDNQGLRAENDGLTAVITELRGTIAALRGTR